MGPIDDIVAELGRQRAAIVSHCVAKPVEHMVLSKQAGVYQEPALVLGMVCESSFFGQ